MLSFLILKMLFSIYNKEQVMYMIDNHTYKYIVLNCEKYLEIKM